MWDATALTSYRQPVLTTSTDGVGTKVAIAQAMDIHDTIGQDLVGGGHISLSSAKPLFMTDYIATGKVVPSASPTLCVVSPTAVSSLILH